MGPKNRCRTSELSPKKTRRPILIPYVRICWSYLGTNLLFSFKDKGSCHKEKQKMTIFLNSLQRFCSSVTPEEPDRTYWPLFLQSNGKEQRNQASVIKYEQNTVFFQNRFWLIFIERCYSLSSKGIKWNVIGCHLLKNPGNWEVFVV